MSDQPSTLSMLLRQSAALLYDCLLLIAVFFIVTAIVVGLNDGQATQHPAYYLLLYVIAFGFFTVFWVMGGQTLGMKAWHLKLHSVAGGSLTFGQCLHRYLLGTAAFGFTYLHAFFDRQHRTLHDRLAGTRMERTR